MVRLCALIGVLGCGCGFDPAAVEKPAAKPIADRAVAGEDTGRGAAPAKTVVGGCPVDLGEATAVDRADPTPVVGTCAVDGAGEMSARGRKPSEKRGNPDEDFSTAIAAMCGGGG